MNGKQLSRAEARSYNSHKYICRSAFPGATGSLKP